MVENLTSFIIIFNAQEEEEEVVIDGWYGGIGHLFGWIARCVAL